MTDAEKVNLELANKIENTYPKAPLLKAVILEILGQKDTLYKSKIKELESDNLRQCEHKVWLHNRIKELEAKIARMEGVVEAVRKSLEMATDIMCEPPRDFWCFSSKEKDAENLAKALQQLDEVNRDR